MKKEVSLYLECSLDKNFVGLNIDNKVYDCLTFLNNKTLELLVKNVKDILNKHKLSYSDIDYVYVSQGVGSSTGLRISMAFIKTLLLIHTNIKVRLVNLFISCKEINKEYIPCILDRHNKIIYADIDDKSRLDIETKINFSRVENTNKDFILIQSSIDSNKLLNIKTIDVFSIFQKTKIYKEIDKNSIGLLKPIYMQN